MKTIILVLSCIVFLKSHYFAEALNTIKKFKPNMLQVQKINKSPEKLYPYNYYDKLKEIPSFKRSINIEGKNFECRTF